MTGIAQRLGNRIVNTVARVIVELVNDSTKLQLLQLSGLQFSDDEEDREVIEDGEHMQPYGFYSVPLAGAEAVCLFPNGDRGHPLVIAVPDRRYRPTGGEGGEVGLYNHVGARITFMANGDIEVQPAPGREVLVRSAGGTAEPLVKRSEFVGHTHGPGTLTAGGDPALGATAGAASVTGTTKLRAE